MTRNQNSSAVFIHVNLLMRFFPQFQASLKYTCSLFSNVIKTLFVSFQISVKVTKTVFEYIVSSILLTNYRT